MQYGYRMSKAALNCAGATLARDLKEDGIAVSLIHPGAVGKLGTLWRAWLGSAGPALRCCSAPSRHACRAQDIMSWQAGD